MTDGSESSGARGTDALPCVSVIVPVYNDGARLAQCLRAILGQDYPAERLEIIVVDNASTEDLRHALPDDNRCSMVLEQRRGSYAARNAGVARARGGVLAFTDADCLPRPNWIREAVAELRNPSAPAAVGGSINLTFRGGHVPTTGPELYEAMHDFLQHKYVEEWSFAATANLVTTAEIFRRVGPFNGDLKSGGDLDWGRRLKAIGGRLVYSNRAIVDHPSRPTWRELADKSLRVANGLADREGQRARGVHLRAAGRNLRGALTIWVRVWPRPAPTGVAPKARYAAAFSLVRVLRAWVQASRAVQRR